MGHHLMRPTKQHVKSKQMYRIKGELFGEKTLKKVIFFKLTRKNITGILNWAQIASLEYLNGIN